MDKKSFNKWSLHTEYADDVDWIQIHDKKDIIDNKSIIEQFFNDELNEINSNIQKNKYAYLLRNSEMQHIQ